MSQICDIGPLRVKALTWAIYFITGVTIGLEDTTFTVDEGELVEVCVILISGTLEREVTVTLQTSDGTAIGIRKWACD